MSDPLREECGLALIRLLKPLSYYQDKYGSTLWGFYNLFLLMEKQHNRGQDGAGIGALKLGMNPGEPYFYRIRQTKHNPLDRIFNKLLGRHDDMIRSGIIQRRFAASVKKHFEFCAEVYIGHLRYGTSGGYSVGSCHPYFRRSNWPTKNLMLAGNFNLTNTPFLNQGLIERGQHPIFDTDTQTLLEEIGFYLDEEHNGLFHKFKTGNKSGPDISRGIGRELNVADVLMKASQKWDGGYSLVGIVGNGDVFALRDPNGIRPLHYFSNDEVIAFASERAPLMTVFNLEKEAVREVGPGSAVVVKENGSLEETPVCGPVRQRNCSFERIYFSRGNDPDIYKERKALGAALVDQITEAADNDLTKTVLSFIPNTAEIAYYGIINELKRRRDRAIKTAVLNAAKDGKLESGFLDELLAKDWGKTEKVAIKDIKLRTFISQEKDRKGLASHVYDVSYGSIGPEDYLVCVDDSIVRGTTLKQSIIKILARLNPKKIIIASTAPQIRYPDCYGIDMSQLHKFVAFQAAVALLKDRGEEGMLEDIYKECREQVKKPLSQTKNRVKRIYDRFSTEEISSKIVELVSPELADWNGEIQIIYQTIENLHEAMTVSCGDWYFTGNYPTPGGYRVLDNAYINFYENLEGRSY